MTRRYDPKDSIRSDIDRAVQSAIDGGMSAKEFVEYARESWADSLRTKARYDDQDFAKART